MKVLLLNTSDLSGGAAIAATRLLKALNKNRVSTHMIVRDKSSTLPTVTALGPSFRFSLNFILERARIWITNLLSHKELYSVSLANTGVDITNLPEFKQADIIHLHWINQGFLSLKDISAILNSGKPVVWTMHDMWPITGICHHARKCNKYTTTCGECPFLTRKKENDLSTKTFKSKREVYSKGEIHFIGCSQWLTDCAKQSSLTEADKVFHIPNPIDIELYKPMNQQSARKRLNLPKNKKLILFGAAKITDKRKGIEYFIDACSELKQKANYDIEIVLFGKESAHIEKLIPLKTHILGYISNQQDIINIYNAVDLFATPSLEENLPNTIMEAMACGTPCVGFNIGGVPELIDHLHNGYVADYKSTTDFAEGLQWVLENKEISSLSFEARRKVISTYSEEIIAKKYINLYNKLL